MATIVWFHAHPDDEAILTGGSTARAADEGHRNVLVVATNGDHGELPADLAPGESLVDRRRAETDASAAILGFDRVAWLGYKDSGMTGWEQNQDPACFLQAPLDEAAGRLAAILAEEAADIVVTYDWHGNYGHPDHITVHRVGKRAAELHGTGLLFEATMNRDAVRGFAEAAKAAGVALADNPDEPEFDPDAPADDGLPMGMPAAEITHEVDVTAYALRKKQAVSCHRSQVTDTSFFLQIPDELFAIAFGTEWFIQPDIPVGLQQRWLLD
ncbi:MAG: PIG-L family deacetylase [Acidimicrobiales bacterium]|nr:PIG-L family deacetylase [Acidimicrobiales bacterium]